MAQYLIPHESELHRPVLRHPDLQPNNIFCTDDLEVIGLIDWQHSSVLPQFLAAGIPNYFANYHDEESLRFVPPKLPENFSDLDHEEQLEAAEIYRRRHLHFFYVGFTQRFNPSHFQALSRQTDLLTRKAFVHASQPWEGNNIPLRSDLIHITKVWPKLLAENQHETKDVSIHFTQTDIDRTLNRLRQQEETDTQMENIRNLIDVSVDGWTSVSEFEDAVNRAELIKEQALENLDTDEEREMTLRHWPFDDFDEEE